MTERSRMVKNSSSTFSHIRCSVVKGFAGDGGATAFGATGSHLAHFRKPILVSRARQLLEIFAD
jgi:hypothetical protein